VWVKRLNGAKRTVILVSQITGSGGNEGEIVKRLVFAVAIAAVASFVVAATASADVSRNQAQTGTITVNWAGGLIHVFHVTVNPCDGSFTGTGTSQQGVELNENVAGTLRDGNLTYKATYHDTPYDAYSWGYNGPAAGGMAWDSWDQHQPITVTYDLTGSTSYKNHGEYVSQTGGDDAAHSCIGMPINSNK
jgi:hypothetical protein